MHIYRCSVCPAVDTSTVPTDAATGVIYCCSVGRCRSRYGPRVDDLVPGHTSVLLVTPCLEMHQHISLPWLLQ